MPIIIPVSETSTTAQTIVTAALKKIGAIASGETPEAEESSDGLATLNRMIHSWRIDAMMGYAEDTISQAVTTSPVTIGVGATINVTRPVEVKSAYFDEGDARYPLTILNADEWLKVSSPTQSGTPEYLYYDPQISIGNINLYPTPTIGTLSMVVSTPVETFSTLGTTVTLAPGYERAMIYNLAIELAPDFGKEASPTVVSIARDALKAIKRLNIRDMGEMSMPFEYINGTYNIYQG